MPTARAVHSYYTGLSHVAGIHFHPYCGKLPTTVRVSVRFRVSVHLRTVADTLAYHPTTSPMSIPFLRSSSVAIFSNTADTVKSVSGMAVCSSRAFSFHLS